LVQRYQSCLFSDTMGLYPTLSQRRDHSLTLEQAFCIIAVSGLRKPCINSTYGVSGLFFAKLVRFGAPPLFPCTLALFQVSEQVKGKINYQV
jgi:hypothetical protein